MNQESLKKIRGRVKKNKNAVIVTAIVLIVIIVLLGVRLTEPRPSVAAYCKTYKVEKARLAKLPGDTWPSAVFDDSVGDAGEMATSFDRLAKVAPADVKPDVITLQKLYQKVSDDPSQAMSASLSGVGVENNVKTWTDSHCN